MSKSLDVEKTIANMVKKPGLRGRIDAKCMECIYDPLSEGKWRQQVENCTCKACPLYTVRPLSKGAKNE